MFDINDRRTWDWVEGETTGLPEGTFLIDREDKTVYYRIVNGRAVRFTCADSGAEGEGLVFDPTLLACAFPFQAAGEAEVYEWAVSQGQVRDQRSA